MKKKKVITLLLLFFLVINITGQNSTQGNSGITTIENINSLSNFLDKFKGKVIYVDVLSSRCKGCIMQLADAKKLDSYFNEKDIVKVYISIDPLQNVAKCLELLNKNDATGYFLPVAKAGGTFWKEFSDTYFQEKKEKDRIYVLPTYIIVDKNGNFVERKPARPDKPEELKAQFEKYL